LLVLSLAVLVLSSGMLTISLGPWSPCDMHNLNHGRIGFIFCSPCILTGVRWQRRPQGVLEAYYSPRMASNCSSLWIVNAIAIRCALLGYMPQDANAHTAANSGCRNLCSRVMFCLET
jgi:hypothetical protein